MTAAKQEPRRHHLVPRFFLDQWSVDGTVQVTDLLRQRHTYTLRPEHALVETDFYRINPDTVDGGSPVAWEAWLSAIEGAAAPLLPPVRDAGLHTLPLEQQGQFLQFLAVQITRYRQGPRTPASRSFHADATASDYPATGLIPRR